MQLLVVEQGADIEKSENHGRSPICVASAFDCLEVARYLLEQGANRDKTGNEGETPLHYAANSGCLEIVKLLMAYGADLNARTNIGELPIDIADDEEIKQAIRDEPRRRMNHGHKRATGRHPKAAKSVSVQQEEGIEEEWEPSNKRLRFDESEAEEGKVAEDDEDSEPSSDEEDD